MMWVALGGLMWMTAAAAANQDRKLDMFVGEVRVIDNTKVTRVAVGNGKLLRVRSLPRDQLLLIAEEKGSTSVRLWHPNGGETSMNVRIHEHDREVRVHMEKMINMEVRIVEFRKQSLDDLGVEWTTTAEGPVLRTVGDLEANSLFRGSSDFQKSLPFQKIDPFKTYFGIATEIGSRLNLLASNGDAMILAEPNLSCRNGGVARFLAGGEVPLPVVNALGQTTVTYKEFGIQLDIEPAADESGAIFAKLRTEVSALDSSVSVQGLPGFLKRMTQTEVNVRDGQTIVIAGLLNEESAKDIRKFPGLGDVPIIGTLFRSTRFQNQQTELVVFVTPRIQHADSERNAAAIDKANKRLEQRRKRFDKRLQNAITD
ncbi:MAG TPA: pilus assembly protein N-terminal domain-containing protein [Acidiferrobacterales bacterium]